MDTGPPAGRGLSKEELEAVATQASDWKGFLGTTLGEEKAISDAMAKEIEMSNTRSVYHVFHVLPDFIPAMRQRALFVPSYPALRDKALQLAASCNSEKLSLNQTLTTVSARRKQLQSRMAMFLKMYSENGGAVNGSLVDFVNSQRVSTEDLLNTLKILLGTNPKTGTTRLARAKNLLGYWKLQLGTRDPDAVEEPVKPPGTVAGPGDTAADEASDDGGKAAAAADAGLGASAGPESPDAPPKTQVKLQFDKQSISRAKKWVSFWQVEMVAAQQEEEKIDLADAASKKARDDAIKSGKKLKPSLPSSAAAAASPSGAAVPGAAAAAAVKAAVPNAGAAAAGPAGVAPLPKAKLERYAKFLRDWEAKLAAAPAGSRRQSLAADWVKFWREKLAGAVLPSGPTGMPSTQSVMRSDAALKLGSIVSTDFNTATAATVTQVLNTALSAAAATGGATGGSWFQGFAAASQASATGAASPNSAAGNEATGSAGAGSLRGTA